MIPLLAHAIRICAHRFDVPAVTLEQELLDLGFTDVVFPSRGPIRARYLGVEYVLE